MKTLNVISPWPNQRNGIADYAEQISRHLVISHNIITESIKYNFNSQNLRILHPRDNDTQLALSNGINLFHFGNNPDHIFEVPLFMKYSGNVVLHDISLHYLSELTDLLIPGFFEYVLKLEQPKIADRLIRLWQTSKQKTIIEYQELNLISWLRPAKNIIVHSHFAKQIVKGYLPNNKVHVIPHFSYQFGMNITKILNSQKKFRIKHGISNDEIIISSVGFMTKNKQYDAIIKAFDKISPEIRDNIRFVIAGESRPSEYDLRTALQGTSVANRVIVLDYLNEADLIELLASSDAVINLRYPTFGESSGSIARALGCGCITIVSDGGSYKELSDEFFWKVPSKQDPSFEIAGLLEKIFCVKSEIFAIRSRILEYASSNLHPSVTTNQYMEVLNHES